MILIHLTQDLSICAIAKLLGRNKSTIVTRTNCRAPQARRSCRHKLQDNLKPRRPKGYVSNRGKIPITHELSERPIEANGRSRQGDWEADTIVGFNRKSGLLTLVDRKSRFLIATKLKRLGSVEVRDALLKCLQGEPLCSLTLDRGREFQLHKQVTQKLESLQAVVDQLNKRPRKCLGYKTPWELWFSQPLHLT